MSKLSLKRPKVAWLLAVVSFACSSSNEPGATPGISGGAGGGAGATVVAGSSSMAGSSGSPGAGATATAGTASGGDAGSAAMAGGGAGGGGGTGGSAGAGGAGFTYEPIASADWDELPLYPGDPPNFKAGAPAETLNDAGHIGNVSVPTLRRYPMDGSKATGWGYLVFPGGGYSILDMDTHAKQLADRVGPLGIAVLSVKYRVGGGTTDAPRDALLDAKRALRLVKQNAPHWGISLPHLGIIGYSAGSHLVLNLAANFDTGDAQAADPIEKHSSRPAFVGSMATWSFGASTSPFTFPSDVPPTFFCHAQDDGTAPIALPQAVEAQIKAKGAATQLDFYATGAHSTCHPGDPAMEGHNWPDKFWPFIQTAVP